MTDRPLREDPVKRENPLRDIYMGNDPIIRHLERQDRYWRENPRDEAITGKVGWEERWETMEPEGAG